MEKNLNKMLYPTPISLVLEKYELEEQPFRRVHRLIDLAEAIIKFHTVVIISNYIQSKEIEDEVKGILGLGLKTPSLGIWAAFTEKIYPHIPVQELVWKDFPSYFKKILKISTDKIIPFRNSYAHGSTPSDKVCLKDINELYPFVEKVLNTGVLSELTFLTAISSSKLCNAMGNILSPFPVTIEYSLFEGNCYLLTQDNSLLDLNLLLLQKGLNDIQKKHSNLISLDKGITDKQIFFFFNDLRDEKNIKLLNYDESLHLKEKDLMKRFLEVYPLKEWEKKVNSEFKSRIEELTENFKGRIEELWKLKKFIIENEKGHFFLWGGPGVGKSSLLARAIQELNWDVYKQEIETSERIENIEVLEYFIRRGTRTAEQSHFLVYMNEQLEHRFKTGVQRASTPAEQSEKFFQRLQVLSEKYKEGKKKFKLILFIDGLDEGEDDMQRVLPIENYPGILVFFSSRDIARSRKIYSELLNPVTRQEERLSGLSEKDIRSLLYEYVNKYDIQQEYVDAIAKRSEGNPLYLKLLCHALFNGEIRLNDIEALPKEIGNFYESILNRFLSRPNGEKIVELLFTMAVTLDFLHRDIISNFLGVTGIQADQLISEATEVLFENPLTAEFEDWQLFHESLRDFLKLKYPRELREKEEEILQLCSSWEKLVQDKKNLFLIDYILKYYATHLYLSYKKTKILSEKETLQNLVRNEKFRKTQVEYLKFYDIPLNDSSLVLEQIINDILHDPITPNLDKLLNAKNLNDVRVVAFYSSSVRREAEKECRIAFSWASDNCDYYSALRRISIIREEKEFFRAVLFLMYIALVNSDIEKELSIKLIKECIDLLKSRIQPNTIIFKSYAIGNGDPSDIFISDFFKRLEQLGIDTDPILKLGEIESTKEIPFVSSSKLTKRWMDLFFISEIETREVLYDLPDWWMDIYIKLEDEAKAHSINSLLRRLESNYNDRKKKEPKEFFFLLSLIPRAYSNISNNLAKEEVFKSLRDGIFYTVIENLENDISEMISTQPKNGRIFEILDLPNACSLVLEIFFDLEDSESFSNRILSYLAENKLGIERISIITWYSYSQHAKMLNKLLSKDAFDWMFSNIYLFEETIEKLSGIPLYELLIFRGKSSFLFEKFNLNRFSDISLNSVEILSAFQNADEISKDEKAFQFYKSLCRDINVYITILLYENQIDALAEFLRKIELLLEINVLDSLIQNIKFYANESVIQGNPDIWEFYLRFYDEYYNRGFTCDMDKIKELPEFIITHIERIYSSNYSICSFIKSLAKIELIETKTRFGGNLVNWLRNLNQEFININNTNVFLELLSKRVTPEKIISFFYEFNENEEIRNILMNLLKKEENNPYFVVTHSFDSKSYVSFSPAISLFLYIQSSEIKKSEKMKNCWNELLELYIREFSFQGSNIISDQRFYSHLLVFNDWDLFYLDTLIVVCKEIKNPLFWKLLNFPKEKSGYYRILPKKWKLPIKKNIEQLYSELSHIVVLNNEWEKASKIRSIFYDLSHSEKPDYEGLLSWFERSSSLDYRSQQVFVSCFTQTLAIRSRNLSDLSFFLRLFRNIPMDIQFAMEIMIGILVFLAVNYNIELANDLYSEWFEIDSSHKSKKTISEPYLNALKELDRDLEEDLITRKGYEKKVSELKEKFNIKD